ncbi:uncharacterized protein LOC135124852 [Zophobas morio]|uniref:uncharacterized protein LOC135124852 n=1 Tax=Zophobas morio TaxID=2755281 RepID=UPI003083AA74
MPCSALPPHPTCSMRRSLLGGSANSPSESASARSPAAEHPNSPCRPNPAPAMEETEVVGLSKLKETVAPSDSDKTPDTRYALDYYPFAVVFRLRVLQIVCGISFLVIGTVAFIEEKGRMNLGLGIPAGGATILAAAASIHTTKGFGGYRTSTCMPGSHLRFLGPSVKIAVPLTILWATACSFLAILILQSTKVLSCYRNNICVSEVNPYDDKNDLLVLAAAELLLAVITFLAVFLLLRIDCKYDPD